MKAKSLSSIPTWQYLLELIRYKPLLYFTNGLLASGVFYFFLLVPGLIIRQVFDTITVKATTGFNVWTLLALLVGSVVAQQTFMLIGATADGVFRIHVATLLRKHLLARIWERPGAQALPASSGEAIARFRDDITAILDFLTFSFDPIAQGLAVLIGLAILVRVNPWLALVVFMPLVITLAVVNIASKRIRNNRQANQEAIGAVTGLLGEIFTAVQAIKVAGTQKRVIQYLEKVNEVRRQAALKDLLLQQLLYSFLTNMANLGTAILLLAVAQMMQTKTGTTLTIGDFGLFISYLGEFAAIASFFGESLTRYYQTEVSLLRLTELIPGVPPLSLVKHEKVYLWGNLPQLPYTPKTAQHRLETLRIKNLSYHYPSTECGIAEVSLTLKRGTLTVITGRIGSGKSTLLRVLLGLLPKQAGEIFWNNHQIEDPAAFFVPPRSAYTAQVPQLFSETLRNNILMGLPEDAVDLETAIYLAVMEKDIANLENGLDTLVGPRGTKLSGGQIQRSAAARMFVRESELLIFDDLSSALDVETERTLWQRLLETENFTCLAVSHRQIALHQADQIIVLKDGRVEAMGKLQELLATCEEMQRLWSEDIGQIGA
ncbi:ABC transporter ATP-binding protein [Nostoc sp.]|uniref:ABC transporter ATP-binding protein n=1 Tax=Nostoc sp. TaxID=1180 RepID=UPI002FFB4B7F